ncbi:hypothetical protein DFH09DRAFT_1422245 [Mycena vulgaris]|nr:hypothetical protein DFH09DRAFT_1422245 [Mycena vulgaris]
MSNINTYVNAGCLTLGWGWKGKGGKMKAERAASSSILDQSVAADGEDWLERRRIEITFLGPSLGLSDYTAPPPPPPSMRSNEAMRDVVGGNYHTPLEDRLKAYPLVYRSAPAKAACGFQNRTRYYNFLLRNITRSVKSTRTGKGDADAGEALTLSVQRPNGWAHMLNVDGASTASRMRRATRRAVRVGAQERREEQSVDAEPRAAAADCGGDRDLPAARRLSGGGGAVGAGMMCCGRAPPCAFRAGGKSGTSDEALRNRDPCDAYLDPPTLRVDRLILLNFGILYYSPLCGARLGSISNYLHILKDAWAILVASWWMRLFDSNRSRVGFLLVLVLVQRRQDELSRPVDSTVGNVSWKKKELAGGKIQDGDTPTQSRIPRAFASGMMAFIAGDRGVIVKGRYDGGQVGGSNQILQDIEQTGDTVNDEGQFPEGDGRARNQLKKRGANSSFLSSSKYLRPEGRNVECRSSREIEPESRIYNTNKQEVVGRKSRDIMHSFAVPQATECGEIKCNGHIDWTRTRDLVRTTALCPPRLRRQSYLPSNALPLAAVPETRSFAFHISPNVTPTTLSSFPGVPSSASALSMDTPARYVPRAFTYNTPVNNNTFGAVNDSGYHSLSSRTSSYHLPPAPAHLPDKSPCDTYLELYQAGDLRVRGGSGNTWDLQCLTFRPTAQ